MRKAIYSLFSFVEKIYIILEKFVNRREYQAIMICLFPLFYSDRQIEHPTTKLYIIIISFSLSIIISSRIFK